MSGMAGSSTHKTIEDLNPRSRPVVSLKKVCDRAIVLRQVCVEVYERVGWPEMLWTHPASLGGFGPRLKDMWGDRWWLHPESRQWPELVVMWRRGSLDRQINDMAATLPEEIRRKILE